MDDSISRKAGEKQEHQTFNLDDAHEQGFNDYLKMVLALPPVQPEIRPINYKDCASAMFHMRMENVITDWEYNHIMDKLNAYWEKMYG